MGGFVNSSGQIESTTNVNVNTGPGSAFAFKNEKYGILRMCARGGFLMKSGVLTLGGTNGYKASIEIGDQAVIEIASHGGLAINSGSSIIVKAGGSLIIRNGCDVAISGNGKIIVRLADLYAWSLVQTLVLMIRKALLNFRLALIQE
jgi:hypothetical protein